MIDLTLSSLSKLYDEIALNTQPMPFPVAALLPIQSRYNEIASMIIQQLHVPVYRSAWIGNNVRGLKPRSAYKTRRGYKRALRYWRKWDRMMDRTQEKVAYLFMEKMEDQMKNIMGIPPSVFEFRKPSTADEMRRRHEGFIRQFPW